MQDDFDDGGMGLADDEAGGPSDLTDLEPGAGDLEMEGEEPAPPVGRTSGGARRGSTGSRKAAARGGAKKAAGARKAAAKKGAKKKGAAKKAAKKGAKKAAKKAGGKKKAAARKGAKKGGKKKLLRRR